MGCEGGGGGGLKKGRSKEGEKKKWCIIEKGNKKLK